ncbi:MAG: hypothetical protein HJJLKODD_00509 [Phycisphaerae bacterium]|nr:hypothetical protein [Phycisphaerae bacterium]
MMRSAAQVNRWSALSCCLMLLSGAVGCNWMTGLALVLPEPTRKVQPEFRELTGAVTVLVWAPLETMYDYPYVRLEVASHVVDELHARLKEVRCTDVSRVEDYLEQQTQTVVDPELVGREFGTRYLVYIELLQFQFRDPYTPDLLQGQVRASITIYDFSKPDTPPRRFELTPIEATVPGSQPIRYTQASAVTVRKQTYETVAGLVAKKFYAYEEKVE